MATLNELYPSVPYNVLAYTPPSFLPDAGTQATPADLTAYEQLLKNLEKGINDGKYTKAIADVLQAIFIDDTINYQTYVNIGLSLITIAVPEIGIFTPFIGLFFAALNKHDAPPPPNAKDIFEAMKPAIQEMIDRTLSSDEQTFLNGEVSGLQNLASLYQSTMEDVQSAGGFDKADPGLIKKFTDEVLALNTFYTDRLPVFVTDNTADRTLLGLPYYAVLASMHLMLLRDIITKGPIWDSKINFTPNAIDSFKHDLKNNIKLYSKTIYDVYQKGLASYGNPSDLESFAKKQKYIEIMTTHCLDFARLFPTFDTDLYPQGSGDINLQKTRRLLSPLIPIRTVDGVTLKDTPVDTSNWPDYENGLFPNPRERVLKQITLHRSYRASADPGASKLNPYLWGIEVEDTLETRLYGKLPTVDPQMGPDYISIPPDNPVVQINMDTWSQPPQGGGWWNTNIGSGSVRNLSFLQQDGSWINSDNHPGGTEYKLPGAHYLSYLYGTPFNTDNEYDAHVSALAGVSTPQEAMGDNILGIPDEDGKISSSGFAWENGDIANGIGSLQVVKETITGTNAVKLNYQQIVKLPIQNKTKLSYNVRIHYASKNEIKGFFHIYTGSDDLLKGEVTFPSTEVDDVKKMVAVQGDNGKYALHVFETPVTLPVGQFTAYIQNNSTEDFYLDRIEFVPVTSDDNDTDITIPFHASLSIQPGESQTIWKSPDSRVGISTDFTTHVLNQFLGFAQYYKSGEALDRSSMGDLSDHVQKSISTGFDEIRILNTEVGSAPIVGTVSGSIDLSSNNNPGNNPGNNPNDTVTIDTSFGVSKGDTQIIWTAPQSKLGVSTKFQLNTDSTIELHYLKSGVIQQPIGVYYGDDPDILIQDSVPTGFDQIEMYNAYDFYNDYDTTEGSLKGTISFASNSSRNTFVFFEKQIDLDNITTQVNALFASGTQNRLAQNVSDHDIEEVVLKVDALSDEVFGEEKKALRKLVNQAKRLSKARNLLVGGSFENWDAWYKGRSVVRLSDHELLKSDYVFLPPPKFSPSYIFQKVEESKLKANTRYVVSGFIAHAEDLEIVVSRYGQEIQKVVQVPYGEAFPLTSGGVLCCMSRPSSDRTSTNPHFFSYSIDVGELDMTAGPGIEFGLRIVGRTGVARVSNLEIREERSLTADEIRKVQRVARNWRSEYEKERAEVTGLIQPVINRINGLYENGNWNGSIRSDISYQNIDAIVLPTLPKLRHWFMSDRFSEQGDIIAKFQGALNRAYAQLEQNTLLHNGHFTTDAANWTIEGDAHHAILEDGRRILRLPDWSSSVSQTIEIENFDSDKEYQLVFHAQGEGTVSLQHGEEGEYVETHPHKFANFTTSHRQGVTFETNKVTVEIASEDGEFLVDHIALVEAPLPTDDQSSDGNTTSNTNSNTSMNNNQ